MLFFEGREIHFQFSSPNSQQIFPPCHTGVKGDTAALHLKIFSTQKNLLPTPPHPPGKKKNPEKATGICNYKVGDVLFGFADIPGF